MVLSKERVECPLWDPVQDLKYLIVLYIVKEWENDRWIGASCSDADVSPVKRSESDDLLVDLRPDLQLWSRALGSHWENEIVDTSGRNELSPKAGRPLR